MTEAAIRRGDSDSVEATLAAVLRQHPEHPDALHQLGLIALQRRQFAQAVELIHRSLRQRPSSAKFEHLAGALQALGRSDEALACYDQAIQIDPNRAETYFLASMLLIARGQHEQAVRILQKASQLAPDAPDVHFWLAVELAQLDYLERAAAAFRRAIELRPDHPESHGRLASVLAKLGRHGEAVRHAEEAARMAPGLPEAHNNLGWCLEQSGQTVAAIASYRRAIELNPRFVMALGNLGAILDKQGDAGAATELFERARDVEPSNLDVLNMLAGLYSRSGRYADALATAEAALRVRPHDPSAHGHRALALLSFGRYDEGFREYEWRWECKDFTTPVRQFDQPRWTGRTDPTGRTVLVHSEQGFGDNIQFARYLPMLADRGARVIVEAPVALCGLMAGVRGIWRVVASGVRPPPFDLQAPLLSLPHAMGTSLENVPRDVPYFSIPPDRVDAWRERLALSPDRINIGLVWRGNSKPNPKRSIPLVELASLARHDRCFVSLQVGQQGAEADSPPPGMHLIDLRNELKDFLDAAAVMSQLDLVITIDTAAAHLSGALGLPTWTLLIRAADWRWLQPPRVDSPWYPTMRLYRQSRADDWTDPIARVAEDLAGFEKRATRGT